MADRYVRYVVVTIFGAVVNVANEALLTLEDNEVDGKNQGRKLQTRPRPDPTLR